MKVEKAHVRRLPKAKIIIVRLFANIGVELTREKATTWFKEIMGNYVWRPLELFGAGDIFFGSLSRTEM